MKGLGLSHWSCKEELGKEEVSGLGLATFCCILLPLSPAGARSSFSLEECALPSNELQPYLKQVHLDL